MKENAFFGRRFSHMSKNAALIDNLKISINKRSEGAPEGTPPFRPFIISVPRLLQSSSWSL